MKAPYSSPIFSLLLLLIFSLVLNIAKAQTPIVTSIYPTTGNLGDTINLYGSNFSSNPSDNIVYFGTNHATVLSASSNILSVIVPSSANKAPIKVYTPNTVSNTTYFPSPNNNIYFTQTYSPSKQSAQDFDFDIATRFPNCPMDSNYGVENFVGDMDGDALPDFVSWSADSFGVLLNNSSFGNISLNYGYKMKLRNIENVEFADFDNNGTIDFVLSLNNGTIYIYKNISTIGNLSFVNVLTLNSPPSGSNYYGYALSVGDLNDDAKPDIAAFCCTSTATQVLNVFLNISVAGGINFTGGFVFPLNSIYKKMNICDIDNDGKNDVVAFGEISNTYISEIYILRNNSSSGIIGFLPEYKMTQNFYGQIKIADLDGDNKLDFLSLYFYGTGLGTLVCFKNACTSVGVNFTKTYIPIYNISGIKRWGLGDINGDGKIDFVGKAYEDYFENNVFHFASRLYPILNQSNSSAISFKTQIGPNCNLLSSNYSSKNLSNIYISSSFYKPFNSINVCDLNADGKSDILNVDLYELFAFKNQSNNSNANLLSVYIDKGSISPYFNKNTLYYFDSLSTNVSSIKVSATSEDDTSLIQIRINGGLYSTVHSQTLVNLSLNTGNNLIEILVTAPDGISTKTYSILVTRTSLKTELNIKAFLQGLYIGNQQMISSISAVNYYYYPNSPANSLADTIMVELYSSVFPYTKVFSQKTILDINGNASIFFNSGGSYYVVIKHRNSIATWSAAPVYFSTTSPITYDFTTSASKAYGGNLIDDGYGTFMIYTGDINHDGSVDFNDYPEIDYFSYIGYWGYTSGDLNGDAYLDFNDYPLLDVNSSNGVMVRSPQP